MKYLSGRFLLFTTGLLFSAAPVLAAPAAVPAIAPKATDRFERTKEHIDALLKQRLKPVPLPAVLPNPFQSSGTVPTGPGSGGLSSPDQVVVPVEPEKPLTDDDEILAHYAAALKISGQMMVNGLPHLIINSSPYKEGGNILVKGRDDTVYYLKVIRIAPDELTLGYNAAVFTLPLK